MARKSNKTLAIVAVGLTPAAILITTGCGGGDSGHSAVAASDPAASRGVLTLKVTFPKKKSRSATPKTQPTRVGRPANNGYDGSIPQGTQSVKVMLINPTTGASLALPQTITAPPDSSGVDSPQTISFTNLPVGPVRVQVLAFPTLRADTAEGAGENNPIAVGRTDAQILANQTIAAQVLMQLTIDHITLTPEDTTLTTFLGQTSVTLTAQAFDKNNAPLLYPFTFDTSNATVATLNQTGPQTVEVGANNTGTATITATEVNSQMMITASVTVSNGP